MGKLDKLKKIVKLTTFDSDIGENSTKSTVVSN